MRKFKVFVDRNIPGVEQDEDIVEMPDDATDEECNEVCSEVLDILIGNNLYTGWDEITDDTES